MIPYLLAIAGGYLIGSATDMQYAYGGRINVRKAPSDNSGLSYLELYDKDGNTIGYVGYKTIEYLSKYGYPKANEFHIALLSEYQGKGYFKDALIELLKMEKIPVFITNNYVTNKSHIKKAISKLDKNTFEVKSFIEDESTGDKNRAYIIDLKK